MKKKQIWGNHLRQIPDSLNITFCAGRDVFPIAPADQVLLPFDIMTNLAHSQMLHEGGLLKEDEFFSIRNALLTLKKLDENEDFLLDPAKEDVHINIEHFVTNIQGQIAGKKMHSGRSRNDQVATDMRLYLRAELIELCRNLSRLIDVILERAQREPPAPMPGYTHYQPAMWTDFGHWLTCWSQGLLRNLERFYLDLEMLNFCPLGAAAGFGTTWKINRERTAELLGFDGVIENSLDCISARGEAETQIASHVSLLINQCSTVAQDIILLSHPYFNMIHLEDAFVTGSSIMPQKKNPDFAEIIRAKAAYCHGSLLGLLGVQKGAMTGYNRDTQQTKYTIMDIFREIQDIPNLLTKVIESMELNRLEMYKKCKIGFMNSADIADWLAYQHGLSFRDAYNIVASSVRLCQDEGVITQEALQKSLDEQGCEILISTNDFSRFNDPEQLVDVKQHTGSPSQTSICKMIDTQKRKNQDWLKKIDRIDFQAQEAFEKLCRA